MLVDSHCHLNFPDFREDLDAVLERARAAGVGVMQTICTKMSEFEEVRGIAERYEDVYCSVGVHPHEAANAPVVTPEHLISCAQHPKVIGIGETGLDYYYEHSPRRAQKESFLAHIEAARQTGLPIIVHTREAEEDTVRILAEEMKRSPFPGLIHCFTSSKYLSDICVELGFYISISGIVTFKRAEALRDVVATVPLSRLLIETDAPYLAPMPYRGKRNEPSLVEHTNRIVADLHHTPEDEMARITAENFFTLFRKAAG
jgi:TatD DNase family protein